MWSITLDCPGCFARFEGHFAGGDAYPTFFCRYCDSILVENGSWAEIAGEIDPLGRRQTELITVQGPVRET